MFNVICKEVKNMEVELLRQYVTSLKKVVCKDRLDK